MQLHLSSGTLTLTFIKWEKVSIQLWLVYVMLTHSTSPSAHPQGNCIVVTLNKRKALYHVHLFLEIKTPSLIITSSLKTDVLKKTGYQANRLAGTGKCLEVTVAVNWLSMNNSELNFVGEWCSIYISFPIKKYLSFIKKKELKKRIKSIPPCVFPTLPFH